MAGAVERGELPDSILRGANFFAERADFAVDTVSTHSVETAPPKFLHAIIPPSLVHLTLLPRLLRYDAVIASDGLLVGCVVSLLGRFRGRRPRWILVAINTSTLIRRHAKHPVRRRILRFCLKRCAAIVCLSQQQRHDLIRFGIRGNCLHEIRFGVDSAYWSKVSANEGAVVLSIGKDSGRDYPTLLLAAERAGLPTVIIASKKNIPGSARIPENVKVLYDVPLGSLSDMYREARVVVVASLPDDSIFGTDCSGQTVVLESLAAGRPVIATHRSWLAEYLSPEDYVSVPAKDSEKLAEAMRRLWDDGHLRKRLAAHGARTVRERYSSRRYAEDLAALVDTLLS